MESVNNMKMILKSYYDGWKQLKKCQRCFLELSTSFKKMLPNFPEIHELVLNAVLLVLEANANFFYINMQKYAGNKWEAMAKTAKCTSDKLYSAEQQLKKYKNIDLNLITYCHWASFFYKAYSLWCLINHYQFLAKMEDYPEGMDYRTTTASYVSMSQDLERMQQTAQAIPNSMPSVKQSFDFYYKQVWMTQNYKIQQIYADVIKENLKNPEMGKIAFGKLKYGTMDDYCSMKQSQGS